MALQIPHRGRSVPLLHYKDSAQFLSEQPAPETDGCESKYGGDQECAQKYFSLGSNWHLGVCHHLPTQGSKLANPACRSIDISKFLRPREEFQWFSVVATKIWHSLYQTTAEVYSSEAPRRCHLIIMGLESFPKDRGHWPSWMLRHKILLPIFTTCHIGHCTFL